MAVVLPVPAGANASWTRRPEVARSRTSWTCPRFNSVPFGLFGEQGGVDGVGVGGSSAELPGGGDDPVFGEQDPL